jgi:hypothetical protein
VNPGRCDECAHPTGGCAIYLEGFGHFHRECLQRCDCGFLWPWSLVSSADVIQHCPGCADRHPDRQTPDAGREVERKI